MTVDPDEALVDGVLAELDTPLDPEHPDVALTHETGWSLSAFPSGLVVWENVEEGNAPGHRRSVERAELRQMWRLLAAGDVEAVKQRGWLPGYGD